MQMAAIDDRTPVWLDCDPGHDDAFAILLAAHHPGIRLLGVSTVFGNASVENTTRNACSILTAIGKAHEVPVYAGASRALSRPPLVAPTDIHGETGLDGTVLLPDPAVAARTSPGAIEAAAAALLAEKPGTAWFVATGAYTNAARLFDPAAAHNDDGGGHGLAAHVRGVALMGGAVGGGFTPAVLGSVDGVPRVGNYTPFAEFNVLADPEAAAALFGNPVLAPKTTLIPLDLTHQVLATADVRNLLLRGHDTDEGEEAKSDLRVMLVELLMFFAQTYRDVFGITAGPPLHDPAAVAAVLAGAYEIPFVDRDPATAAHPERYQVTVVTEGTYEEARAGARTGQTVVRLLPPGEQGVRIPRGMDVAMFWKVLEECVARADATQACAINSVSALNALSV